jgi:hypothetical protein
MAGRQTREGVMLSVFQQKVIIDRLDSSELVDFLQVPIEQVLQAALENDWVNDENIDDLLELVNLRKE